MSLSQLISLIMRFFIYTIIFIILFILYVKFIERRSVFFPHVGKTEWLPSEAGMPYEDVFFETPDGFKIHGWFVPAEDDPKEALTFLYIHGNAGNINNRVDRIALLHELGGNVFIFDYRGYGISEGRPSEEGIYTDAVAAFDALSQRADIDPQKIIIYGVSLGGAPAAELALRRRAAGLILHSTFTSARDMAKKIFPIAPPFLIGIKMTTVDKLPQISGIPKLIIHAPQDEVIPYRMGEKLFEVATEPKEFLRLDGAHNDAHITSREAYVKGMREFLGKYYK